jgi:hypothetical protein
VTFHISGWVNNRNIIICSTVNPHVTYELERESLKVNVWCGVAHKKCMFSLSLLRRQCMGTIPQHGVTAPHATTAMGKHEYGHFAAKWNTTILVDINP